MERFEMKYCQAIGKTENSGLATDTKNFVVNFEVFIKSVQMALPQLRQP
jgi:hypothetical protein